MKNIGIVTYYKIYNYGSVLQAYALSKKIESFGFNAEIIDYLDNEQMCFNKIKKRTYINRMLVSFKSPILLFNTLNTKRKGQKFIEGISNDHKRKFDEFLNEFLKLSKVDVIENKDYYSAFVCGSDQVWQLSAPGLHELYYLRFTTKQKRIAYAPSFGSLTIPWYNKRRLAKYLSEFQYLSIRESSGVDVINKSINKVVPQVLDPVLLMGSEFWDKMTLDIKKDNKFIFCYFLGDISKYTNIIYLLKKKYDASLLVIESGCNNELEAEFVQATPIEFISLMKYSEFVITDSLHGTEFAINFNKDFIVLERNYITVPEQNTRLLSLLSLLNLKDRYIHSCQINDFIIKSIDYINVESILENEREKSNEYLKNALENITNK